MPFPAYMNPGPTMSPVACKQTLAGFLTTENWAVQALPPPFYHHTLVDRFQCPVTLPHLHHPCSHMLNTPHGQGQGKAVLEKCAHCRGRLGWLSALLDWA